MSKYKLEIKTPPRNNQAAFNRVWRRMVVKKYPRCTGKYSCLYRRKDGNACALGYMMPARLFKDNQETAISSLLGNSKPVRNWFKRVSFDMLKAMQCIHDDASYALAEEPAKYFAQAEVKLRKIAKLYHLKVPKR